MYIPTLKHSNLHPKGNTFVRILGGDSLKSELGIQNFHSGKKISEVFRRFHLLASPTRPGSGLQYRGGGGTGKGHVLSSTRNESQEIPLMNAYFDRETEYIQQVGSLFFNPDYMQIIAPKAHFQLAAECSRSRDFACPLTMSVVCRFTARVDAHLSRNRRGRTC